MSLTYVRPPLWDFLNRGKPYEPLAWQVEHLHNRPEKRIALACGRRSGKSFAVRAEVVRECTRPHENVLGVDHPPLIYVAGPTSELSMRVFQPIWDLFVPDERGSYQPPLGFLYKSHDKNRGFIELQNGCRIWRKSGDDPRSMQGERVTLAIVDEAQDMPEDAWQNVMPALADSNGRLIAIGITRGKGRFRSYFRRGQLGEGNFYSASVPSAANPVLQYVARDGGFVSVDEFIEKELAADLTEVEKRQQYYAEWVDEDGQVFPADIDRLFTGTGEPGGGPYIMGLDLGKLHDYTVAYVGDIGRQEIVAKLRFNKIDYVDQVPLIADLYHKWNCRFIHMDKNGPGEAPSEMLSRPRSVGGYGCSVVPFQWSNSAKQGLVSVMIREVERGNVRFLKDDEQLKAEMAMFEGKVTTGGLLKYEAAPGFFDDCVIAAALLIQKMARNKQMSKGANMGRYVSWSQRPKRRRERIAA